MLVSAACKRQETVDNATSQPAADAKTALTAEAADAAPGAPKVFETVWEVTESDLSITLPFDTGDCVFAIPWGEDGSTYIRAANTARGLKIDKDDDFPYDVTHAIGCVANQKGSCDFKILWGDEGHTDFASATHITDCDNPQNRTHTYAKPGTYHVRIAGTYDGWGQHGCLVFEDNYVCTDKGNGQLRGVVSFGTVGLTRGAFFGESGFFLPADDMPDASKWQDASFTFFNENAEAFNQDIGHWDTSNVTNMFGMFYGEKTDRINQSIERWDTSKVTDMSHMFSRLEAIAHAIGRVEDFHHDIGRRTEGRLQP